MRGFPLYRSLHKHGATRLTIKVFVTDHPFENVKDRLQELIVDFLKTK